MASLLCVSGGRQTGLSVPAGSVAAGVTELISNALKYAGDAGSIA